MQKNTFINIGLSAGSIIGFFLVIEFGLRITGLQTVAPNPPKIYQRSQNPEISYELKPNLKNEKAYKAHVSTDGHGFRLNAPNPNPNPIIAVLGDSITFGYGVNDNETLSARLEQYASHFQFLNAAVPGYELTQETATYGEKILSIAPQGVIIVFYWNDLNGTPPGILDDDGVLRGADWDPSQKTCQPIKEGVMGWIPGKCALDDHSAFYKALKKLINLRQSKVAQKEERESAGSAQENVNKEYLDAYVKQLREFSRLLPERRYFVIWPDDNLHTETRPQLIAAAERAKFTVIDLYDTFGNAVPTLPWDTVHPHPDAIEEAANIIAERMR